MMIRTSNLINNAFNFTGLTPKETYVVNVTSVNNAGSGESNNRTISTVAKEEAVPMGN